MNSTTKQRTVVDLATAEQLLEPRAVPFDAAATWADIATVHDPAFVEAVRTGRPLGLAQSQGFTWSPAFADALCRIWNGHIAACRMALGAGTVLHPVSGAHHAGFARGSGFCTFNYLVGAARALLTDGLKRVPSSISTRTRATARSSSRGATGRDARRRGAFWRVPRRIRAPRPSPSSISPEVAGVTQTTRTASSISSPATPRSIGQR